MLADKNASQIAEGAGLKAGHFKNLHGSGRVRVVKLMSTAGTMQACSGGQPASVIALRQSEVSALLNCEGLAAPALVLSAWLVAVICTVAGEGKSAGAMKTPGTEIVPTREFPPATMFTLQLTLVSVAFVTVAVNVNWLPSMTEPLDGATLTVIGGGGGGGATAPPPPQPKGVSC